MTYVSTSSSRPRIPVWRTAHDAYRLGLGAIFSSGTMFRFFVYGSAMTIAVLGVELYFILGQAADSSSSGPSYLHDLVAGVLSSIILAAVQTPLGIAIQRQILLGDVPEGSYFNYAANPPGRNYLLMSCCIYAIFLAASVAEIPFLVISGVNPFDSDAVAVAMEEGVTLMFGVSIVVLAAYLVASLISAKFTFVFPEIASERQTESPWQSLAETRGTVWRLFFLFVVIFLPLAVLYFAAFSAAGIAYVAQYVGAGGELSDSAFEQMMVTMLSSTEFVIAYAVTAVGSALSFVVMVAGAARAYQIRVEGGMSGVAEVFS